ncbi:hypothetical protein Tco_1338276 [Tanacetum coccineum]
MLTKEIRRSSRIDDKVVQDKRQRYDNDLQEERQDQPKEEEVEPRRCKRARTEKLFGPDFVSFMVENEPTSYREGNQANVQENNEHNYEDLTVSGRVLCECVLSSTYTEAEFKDIAST